MINLLMTATNRPAPIGSIMVGIIEGTENYCGDGSVVTGVVSFQGWVRDFCISHVIPLVVVVGGGGVGGGRCSSPSGPLKPAYKSAMLP